MSTKRFRGAAGGLIARVLAASFMTCGLATASAGSVAELPLFLTQKVDPLVMLVLSNDHQLYIKAYTDYDDVDGDGVLDTGYKDSIDYYGYFDSRKCYTHNGSRFAPSRAVPGTGTHACGGSGEWSGNFLNWASMTRMDVLRKVLFGGTRSTDTTSSTVLERVFLPPDIHAFAKVFDQGATTIRKFTPYSSYDAITICNVSDHDDGESQDSNDPPQLRIAEGSWPVWAAGESVQCQWDMSGTPDEDDDEIATLAARVAVCTSDALAEDNCKEYPDGTLKPTGLLQTYGEAGEGAAMRIGLVSGSYRRNLSGGVLRRNAARITGNTDDSRDEIDADTGIFINQGSNDAGIINTISRFRISQYDVDRKTYDDCDTYSISVDELNENSSTRRCGNWGNPVGEMYLETLRYLAGTESPTNAFDASDSSYISGLPDVDWEDPYTDADWCAAPSVILMSTGLNSFDEDQYSSAADIPTDGGGDLDSSEIDALTDEIGDLENITGNSYFIGESGGSSNQLCDAKTIGALSDAEGICPETPNQDGSYKVAGLAWHAHTNDLRPQLGRSGNTNRPSGHELNTDTYALALAQGLPRITVNGMTLLPACQANTNGNADNHDGGWLNCSLADLRIVNLVYSGGELVAGDLLYQWEDSSWGNDYDLDGMERIEFCAGTACSPAVDADELRVTVSSPYAAAGNALRFGYVVLGSTNDGIAFNVVRDGNENFNCLDPELTTSSSCYPVHSSSFNGYGNSYPYSTVTLTRGTSTGGVLEPPLWYAAKYGGFVEDEVDADEVPNQQAEWDADGDGTPDSYFQVTDPADLVTKLRDVFESIAKTSSSAASVATNSTRIDVDTAIYQARFNSEDWHGELLAFEINSDGTVGDPEWDAADKMPAWNLRNIFSWNPAAAPAGDGIAFNWSALSAAQQAALNIAPDGDSDSLGEQRLNWLRGDSSQETRNGGTFRNRPVTVLGDIVNSDPYYVGTPDFRYHLLPGAEGSSYAGFRSAHASRREMLYVGANDGMLHAFDADTGIERFAYVPNLVFGKLAELSAPDYAHHYYVDGSPRAGDAYLKGQWRTILVGTLGAGGPGVFALDVTNPDTFSSDDVLWEFTDADLGQMVGQATIVRLNDGSWAALFGNGFESAAGHAYLYLVNLETGNVTKIQAGDETANGLATPVPVDIDGNRTTDYVYAGDLQGNLWKFDLTGNSNKWGVAYGNGNNEEPLFTATDDGGERQPITVRPAVGVHPDGGYMVYFGTGSFYAKGDNVVTAGTDTQTFYGIRDTGSAIGGRANLQEQVVLSEHIVSGNGARLVSDNVVDYATKHGWYVDLPAAGERAVAEPVLRSDRIIFTTLIPSGEPCDFGGSGWLMELDALNGKRLPNSVLDINEDGSFDEDDYADGTPVSGMRSSVGIIKSPGIISAGTKEYKYASGSTGEIAVVTERNSLDTGRKSWREVN